MIWFLRIKKFTIRGRRFHKKRNYNWWAKRKLGTRLGFSPKRSLRRQRYHRVLRFSGRVF